MEEGKAYTYAPMEPQKWQQIVCGGDVRWNGGKLQQRFVITEYVGSSPVGSWQDWRDVPTIDPQ